MAKWNIKHGNWWMIQWSFDRWISFGIHIDSKKRKNHSKELYYGPYMDIHFLWFIISIGNNPCYSNPFAANVIGRGGEYDGNA